MILASLALALAAFALFAQSMRRHAGPHWNARRSTRLRIVGWGALLASLALRLAGPGWRVGLTEWIGALALCAAAVMLLLTYRPAWLDRVAPVAIVIGLAAALLG